MCIGKGGAGQKKSRSLREGIEPPATHPVTPTCLSGLRCVDSSVTAGLQGCAFWTSFRATSQERTSNFQCSSPLCDSASRQQSGAKRPGRVYSSHCSGPLIFRRHSCAAPHMHQYPAVGYLLPLPATQYRLAPG
ncbi:hypothetical protein BOTBODRAFT_355516 [Botryobasidium botryosum FD-172 SS1]|uniref:Uncharacterized protein n=1 Tax=Botryobasidium botryosum (strain FD-172 SS1) TaxID=930990 RepID=A0A067MGW9_BOTB1|nr:hypothetical protein BOTBODRAFT_355516 [Botryobasidium botryosum FD-172 SS1]